ncbi:MAG: NUDIX hydrolase [Desulfuromonas sp.]|nr:MAG: NUDIX hydrolase [Desulfuromonas sp.]
MSKQFVSEEEFLAAYNPKDFDSPLSTVDVAIFSVIDEALHVLLVWRDEFPCKGSWALPGGFVELDVDASLDATAMRKLREKTGVKAPHLEQVGTFGGPERDPRGWAMTVLYFALMSHEKVKLSAGAGASEAAWHKVTGGKVNGQLAFDHSDLLKVACARLQNKARYTVLPGYVLPEEFTLTALINIYRILLEEEIDNPMMRRRLLRSNMLEETGNMLSGEKQRPAKLYRFAEHAASHVFERNLEAGK